LSIAEKNLEAARGKNLNAAQSDLISKIRNFIKDAGEAAQNHGLEPRSQPGEKSAGAVGRTGQFPIIPDPNHIFLCAWFVT